MHVPLLLAVICCADAPSAGQVVTYPSGREQLRGFLCRPVGEGPFPAVIIVHGDYALDAARRDSRLRAVVTCYGRLTTDPALLSGLNASVFGVFAGKDLGISPKMIDQFRAAMKKAGKRVAGLKTYPICEHGFLN